MKPYFSIIVTTFNNSKTIRKTLDSVVNQTLNDDNYEIIVVDDKSTDHTMDIINTYNNENIKVYQLNQNSGGPSKPRNEGIAQSNGKYIFFLDGDDWLDVNLLEAISLNYLKLDSDIIISKVIKDKDGFQTIHAKFMTINEHHNITGNDIPYLYYYLGPGGKFIKRELIIKNDILFPNNLHFGEDKMFFMEIFSKARSITTVPTISTYVNRSVDNTSLVRKSDFVTKRHSDFVLFKSVLNINDIKFKNKFLVRILEYDLLNNCNSNVFLKLGQDEKEEVFKVIRKIFTHEIITEEIIDLLDKKYNDAILAIYNNDLEKFIQFFNWYRKGIKIISSRDSNLYYYVDPNNKFETIVPFCNIKNLQVSKDIVYLQIDIHNIKQNQVASILFESRTHFKKSEYIKRFFFNKNILTISINKSFFNNLDNGIYNVLVVYDSYKPLNIKYGYTKKVELTNKKITFYPTINGNLSVKVEN